MLEWLAEASQSLAKIATPLHLFGVSFIEAIFFPVPPDVMLIPLVLLRPSEGLFFALLATVGSVLGAAVGYSIGLKGGRPVLRRFASTERINQIESLLGRYDAWATAVAAFTPIPYKVFAIAAGVFSLDLKRFLMISLLSRGARFGLIALLLMRFGPDMKDFIEANFELLTLGIAGIVVLLYIALRLLRWRRVRQQ